MVREIRAKYSNGVLTPLDELDLVDGDEVIITVKEVDSESEKPDMLEQTAGGWNGLVDFDELLEDFKKSRKIASPEVEL